MKGYESYKTINVDWLYQLPIHWKTIQIKQLNNSEDTLFIDGDWIESPVITDYGIRYLTTGNIGPGHYKEQGYGFINEETFEKLNCTEVYPGDLLISRLNEPIGRACIIPDLGYRIITAVDNVILRPKKPFNIRFLMHLMNSPEYSAYTSLISRGATMKRISRGLLGGIKIPFPSGEEQIAIASFLDYKTNLIDTTIEKKKRLIELLKEKRQAVINEAVTKGLNPNVPMKDSGVEWLGEIPVHWVYSKLKWISNIYAGGTPSTNVDRYWENGDVPWLNSGTVNQKRIKSPSNYITQEALLNSSTKWVPKNSILMALAGQGKTKGTVGILEIEATCNQSMAAIVPDKNEIDYEFLYYWLHSNYQRIRGLASSDQRDGLNLVIVGDIFCPLPAIEEQQLISIYLNNFEIKNDYLIEKLEIVIEKLQSYRQSLISEAVTGKIDVRDWQPIK